MKIIYKKEMYGYFNNWTVIIGAALALAFSQWGISIAMKNIGNWNPTGEFIATLGLIVFLHQVNKIKAIMAAEKAQEQNKLHIINLHLDGQNTSNPMGRDRADKTESVEPEQAER